MAEATIEILEASEVEARVLIRYVGKAEDPTLEGTISGPYSENSRTLPAHIPLRATRANEAEAVIPDPCYWSEELPILYRLKIVGSQVGESPLCDQEFGLRKVEREVGPQPRQVDDRS